MPSTRIPHGGLTAFSAATKELANLIREELGRLECCEVAAARHLCPAADVEEVLGELARRAEGIRAATIREDGEPGRHIDSSSRRMGIGEVVEVVATHRQRVRAMRSRRSVSTSSSTAIVNGSTLISQAQV